MHYINSQYLYKCLVKFFTAFSAIYSNIFTVNPIPHVFNIPVFNECGAKCLVGLLRILNVASLTIITGYPYTSRHQQTGLLTDRLSPVLALQMTAD